MRTLSSSAHLINLKLTKTAKTDQVETGS